MNPQAITALFILSAFAGLCVYVLIRVVKHELGRN
jgi:hypothetical protein